MILTQEQHQFIAFILLMLTWILFLRKPFIKEFMPEEYHE